MIDIDPELDQHLQSQFRAILNQITDLKHKHALILHSNQILDLQLKTIKQQNFKQEQILSDLSAILTQLNAQTQISFPEDHDQQKTIQNKEQIQRYSDKILNEKLVLDSSVVNLPRSSLEKLAFHFQTFTEQQVTEAIQSSRQMRKNLERIEQTKEKYQKQRQAQQKLQLKSQQEGRSERGSEFIKRSQNSN